MWLRRLLGSFTLRAWLWLGATFWLYFITFFNDVPSMHLLWSSFAAALVICFFLSRAALSGLGVEIEAPKGKLMRGRRASFSLILRNRGSFAKSDVVLEHSLYNETFGRWHSPEATSPREGERPFRPTESVLASAWEKFSRNWLKDKAPRPSVRYLLPFVPPGGEVRSSLPLDLPLRGLWRMEGASLWGSDPLGFFRIRRRFAQKVRFLVLPRHDAYSFVFDELSSLFPWRGHPSHLIGQGLEFYSVKPYEPGDDLRRLHWRATAKMGKLFVRLFEREREEAHLLMLDLREGTDCGEPPHSSEEAKVEVVASLAHEMVRRGAHVALASFSRPQFLLPPDTGQGHLVQILEALAVVRPTSDSSFVTAVAESLRSVPPGTPLILVTSDPSPEVKAAVEEALSKGRPVLCVLVDAPSFAEEQEGFSPEYRAAQEELLRLGCPSILLNAHGEVSTCGRRWER